jgi:large subunit ribosomal protein L21e
MPRSHGRRRKSRSVLTKDNVVRGISYLLHDYKVGDKVVVEIDPREHNTTPHRRFHGRIGFVEEVGRRTLKVSVKFGDKTKFLQTRFNHIKPLSNASQLSQSEATPPPPPPPPATSTSTPTTTTTSKTVKTETEPTAEGGRKRRKTTKTKTTTTRAKSKAEGAKNK